MFFPPTCLSFFEREKLVGASPSLSAKPRAQGQDSDGRKETRHEQTPKRLHAG
jgi:hypothetical protein